MSLEFNTPKLDVEDTLLEDTINDIEQIQTIEIPLELPLLPVRDIVVFVSMFLPLFIGRDKSMLAAEEAMKNGQFLFIVTQKDITAEDPTIEQLYEVGVVARITRMFKMPDGRSKVLVQGIIRAKLQKVLRKKDYYRVRIDILPDDIIHDISIETEAMIRTVREKSIKILSLRGELTNEISTVLDNIDNPGELADLIASNLYINIERAQELLEMTNPIKRLTIINEFLIKEVEMTAVEARINSEISDEVSRNQKNSYLREKMRAIHKELGEDDTLKEIEEFKTKIQNAKMPKEAEMEATRQLNRLDQMQSDSSEAVIIRSYLDLITDLPWEKESNDEIDIVLAKQQLDSSHLGLAKVKDRILEYLSVLKLNPKTRGSILCFVGPPGVGKTSLGKAIADAIKRKFVRISLGGIKDEAEIRGHRRTYIGALPGRIIQSIKQCQSRNPVFMMDEIDKIGTDYRGDPSAALLEVLDQEQNSKFSDHYLAIPFDLSKVIFILTANFTDNIPMALIDRMEIINLSGYTEAEKISISSKHLIPKQTKESGLGNQDIKITEQVLKSLINDYTCEAGVRNLDRELGTIFRKIARKVAEGTSGPFEVTTDNLFGYLGAPQYEPEMEQDKHEIGIATGLAWTITGGEPLYIEATYMPGKGELIITGQLGEIMQESAKAAVSYARANSNRFDIKKNFFEHNDIHIHVPAGATPKDGPSAGIAIATALISAITSQKVNRDVAMTGEITLRGRVLPIGGLKEKVVGALRAKVKTIIIPEKNKKDLEEIPDTLKKQLKFITVNNIDQVLPITIINKNETPAILPA